MFTTRRRCICNTIYVTYTPVQEVQPWIVSSSARKPSPRKLHFALISKTPFHMDSFRLLNLRKASKAQWSRVCVSSLEKAAWMKGSVFMYGYVSVVLESCTTKHLTFNETLTQAESITVRFELCSFWEGIQHSQGLSPHFLKVEGLCWFCIKWNFRPISWKNKFLLFF